MFSIEGVGLNEPPSRLCADDYFARSLFTVHEGLEQLMIVSRALRTLYTFTETSKLLIEVSVTQRWMLTIASTSKSRKPVFMSICDPSTNPQQDVRCIGASDILTEHGPEVLVAVGAGRFLHLVTVHLRGACSTTHPHVHTVAFPSDVMSVTLHRTDVLVGLRSGRVHTLSPDHEHTWQSGQKFSFVSKGATCHVQFVDDTLFLAAYTNGDLVMGDLARMNDAPLRTYVGHTNQFMQGLVCSRVKSDG